MFLKEFQLVILILVSICGIINSEIISTCMSTKIDLKTNKSLTFCGNWSCVYDNNFGRKIPICKLSGGPRRIVDCIELNEERDCGTFDCVIKAPYLHSGSCLRVKSKADKRRIKDPVACVKPSCPKCPKCPIPKKCPPTFCPPCPIPACMACPTCDDCLEPVCPELSHCPQCMENGCSYPEF